MINAETYSKHIANFLLKPGGAGPVLSQFWCSQI